jgi:hypothetical protein
VLFFKRNAAASTVPTMFCPGKIGDIFLIIIKKRAFGNHQVKWILPPGNDIVAGMNKQSFLGTITGKLYGRP